MKTHIIPDSDVEEFDRQRSQSDHWPAVTSSPAVAAVRPLPPELPDPEDRYTIAQVRANLIAMEQQLASYPVNLSRGPGWVRGQILSMLDRGIAADNDLATLKEIAQNAMLKIAGMEIQRNELRLLLRRCHSSLQATGDKDWINGRLANDIRAALKVP